MAVLLLSLFTALLLAAALWFVIGSRLQLSDDERQNELFNYLAYTIGALPVGFVLVFFGLGG